MSFEVSFERGMGQRSFGALGSRIENVPPTSKTSPAAKDPVPAAKAPATKAPSPAAKAKAKAKRSAPSWWQVVSEAEASVTNPPPREIGTTADGVAWLTENQATKPLVSTLPCGLQFMELKRGRPGAKSPLAHTPCEVHYHGFLLDGTEFDSSFARGSSMTFVPLEMIQAWTVALQLMGEGDTWELYVPSELAYGDMGRSSEKRGQYIPGGAVLVFSLSLLKVKGPSKPRPVR